MLFNSVEFVIFLPLVFALYWGVAARNLRWRNAFLLIASYVFYGWWDWRFLGLIALSSAIDYGAAIGIERSRSLSRRRWFLSGSIGANLGMLGFFKYGGFFVESLHDALLVAGLDVSLPSLRIVLPVGISFYTFQTMSYTIDVYRGRAKATTDPLALFAYVSFFPQLVAGPIERATHLLPQFQKVSAFCPSRASAGLRSILWGLFKKIAVADRLAHFVDVAYSCPGECSGVQLTAATVFFGLQIYCDFSGYSSIAIGCARLFGFELMTNFSRPYLSRSIGEFWHRWHISLSGWFRDYVYIPLGGNRCGLRRNMLNLLVVFVLSGLWHGASWCFVVWGGVHGSAVCFATLWRRAWRLLCGSPQEPATWSRVMSVPLSLASWACTVVFVMFAWVFFRAGNLHDAVAILDRLPSGWRSWLEGVAALFTDGRGSGVLAPFYFGLDFFELHAALICIVALVCVEVVQEYLPWERMMERIGRPGRWAGYYATWVAIHWFGVFSEQREFIYFQF